VKKILAAAKLTGATAVHPGYGFLSENAIFSNMLAENGITFIGPPAKAIVDMGSKSASKNIMIDAGVPVTPGYHGDNQDPDYLKQMADEMGYPVMLKAVLGGGGKGMRMVPDESEFFDMLDAAKREAMKGFADDDMLIEKFLTEPRHVELQVFADQHGNAVHLNERDCSLQRRMQKVLEEAPAPGMSAEQRQKMGQAACDAARAVGYEGAGTVEFLLDTDNSFYFMEMNTRLQVEHPVSEMITGQDFVEWQLRVAAGETLPMTQEEIPLDGHSIEARIYAENPENDFLPGSGHLHFVKTPESGSFGLDSKIRIDAGVVQGDDVSIYYDPMISKLIVHGEDREHALRLLDNALAGYRIVGLPTNIEFVRRCARHPDFVSGDLDINFIEKHHDSLLPSVDTILPSSKTLAMTALASLLEETNQRNRDVDSEPASPWSNPSVSGLRLSSGLSRGLTFDVDGVDQSYDIQVDYRDGEVGFDMGVEGDDNKMIVTGTYDSESGDIVAMIDGERCTGTVVRNGHTWHVFVDGEDVRCAGEDGKGDTCGRHMYTLKDGKVTNHFADAGGSGALTITTPMPGKVVKVSCEVGDVVDKGAALLILEAMKMEHVIRSPADGMIVDRLPFNVGEQVDDGSVLVAFKGEEEE